MAEEFEVSPEYAEMYCQSKAWPLPRLSPETTAEDKYEVIIAGAGPAGLLLRLLLARYGLGDKSVLCVDPKPGPTLIGHADGFNARTLEVLATLGLEHEILRSGREMKEHVRYKMTPKGLEKEFSTSLYFSPARFAQFKCTHQGRLERILLQDLQRYSKDCILYSSKVNCIVVDEADSQFPVAVTIDDGQKPRVLRAKYVVGADGPHSIIRRSVGIEMEGDIVDEIWGVMDFVPETDFDDIRKVLHFASEDGRVRAMVIPREQMSDGNFLLRLYIEMLPEVERMEVLEVNDPREEVRRKKAEIKKEHIIEKLQNILKPFHIQVKAGTKPVWWTTYAVGQRLANKFITDDSHGHPRVFLIGDACHTHSPRQGQGMNISVQDAYYLSWRLSYVLLGWANAGAELLKTYEDERRPWAKRVVFADKRWNQSDIPFKTVREEMRSQVTGCGIEEAPGLLISDKNEAVDWHNRDPLNGVLRTGRRLLNVPVKRWADGTVIDLHDVFDSDGRYRILILTSGDFPHGRSRKATEEACALTAHFPQDIVEIVLMHPHYVDAKFGWKDLPTDLKKKAEMRVFCADEKAYETYCVSRDVGAVALVRPDGIVCITTRLEDMKLIGDMLHRVLVAVGNQEGVQ